MTFKPSYGNHSLKLINQNYLLLKQKNKLKKIN